MTVDKMKQENTDIQNTRKGFMGPLSCCCFLFDSVSTAPKMMNDSANVRRRQRINQVHIHSNEKRQRHAGYERFVMKCFQTQACRQTHDVSTCYRFAT